MGGMYRNVSGAMELRHGGLPRELDFFFDSDNVEGKILAGHNIKFDILYCQKYDKDFIRKLYDKEITLWDTMVVEYLLSGQQEKFASRNKLSEKYGGTQKEDKIKKYWDDGMDTENIPSRELEEYLVEDIKNTCNVFRKQVFKATTYKDPSILNVIKLEMDALRDTILTEWNGMYADINRLYELARDTNNKLTETENYLKKINPDINWSSPKQLQAFLYGGTVKLDPVEKL